MMKDLLALSLLTLICALLFPLAGCAEFTVAKGAVATEAALIADEVRKSAEFTLCKTMTVGAWLRAYGQNPLKAEAWRKLCSEDVPEAPR